MAEFVTWETCPQCGDRAAVGWLEDKVVEFDCHDGCRLTGEEWVELGARRSRVGEDPVP